MSKIRIVNWLLTRKCNLNCDYCAIVKNYIEKPSVYPDMSYYIKNEMSTEVIINGLKLLKQHNSNIFNIFYGGEPMLRNDLPEIIKFCNENEIFYTIISNNTPEVQPLIKKLFDKVGYVEGFTSSVDPMANDLNLKESRVIKSIEGLKRLKEIQAKGLVKDVVAEITVMKSNAHNLHNLVSTLSKDEIYSDITFVDIAKSQYYDFSNITDKNILVKQEDIAKILLDIMNDKKLLVHMKETLFPIMFYSLPSEFDCKLEDGIHNITIDADGSLRLCIRIRGIFLPNQINLSNIFDKEDISTVSKYFYDLLCLEKKNLCKLCNHSCLMMSQYIDNNEYGVSSLVHLDKRS